MRRSCVAPAPKSTGTSSGEGQEQQLLSTALGAMNTPEHQDPYSNDRIVGAQELCCRRGEMLLIQNRRGGPTSD
jgi:hypothetical protein